MNLPLVSVVMPVYNAEKYLKESIDSILNQSYRNIELVIVNDGSTDSSKDIILGITDSRIRLIENERNSGIVFTRNAGLESASGEYIATLDSDDIALPDRLEKQVKFLEENRTHGMCGTFYIVIDGNGNLQKSIRFPTDNEDILTYLMIGNCFCNSTILLRSRLAKELKYREQFDIVEDYELWYRMSKFVKLANLSFFGTYYRVHGNNISVSKMADMFARAKKIAREILTDANITFTERELDVHANLLNSNSSFFEDDDKLTELESWTCKFYKKLISDHKYNQLLLYNMITERWLIIAFKTKRYKKLVYNKLFLLNKRAYLACLGRKIKDKLIKEKS